MTKKNWSDEAIAWETGTGEFDREGTAHNRQFLREDGEGTQYTAPTKDQKWRARDLLDIHWKLTGIKCPESFNRVMSCIVGHVNPNTGACFPRQSTIAIETACHRNTVGRAVQFWVEQKFLETEDRGLAHALAYHPQFKLFEMYYLAVTKDIAAQKEDAKLVHASTTKGVHASTTKGVHDEHQYGGAHNLKVETSKENLKEEPLHEVAHPPSASDAHVVSFSEGKKEEGTQGEQVVSPSLTPEGPTPGQAQEIVSRYCTGHHWQHLTQDDLDAAITAEIEVPGSGRAIVDAAADKNAKEAVNG